MNVELLFFQPLRNDLRTGSKMGIPSSICNRYILNARRSVSTLLQEPNILFMYISCRQEEEVCVLLYLLSGSYDQDYSRT